MSPGIHSGLPLRSLTMYPLQDVSVMLGHASTRMTQHYARVMNASLKKSMIHVKEQLTQ